MVKSGIKRYEYDNNITVLDKPIIIIIMLSSIRDFILHFNHIIQQLF